ncbi:MAG TPA: hypothetical protein VIE16_09445 [Phenylobacterium sp.]
MAAMVGAPMAGTCAMTAVEAGAAAKGHFDAGRTPVSAIGRAVIG